MSPGPWQVVIVALIVLVLFGNRLPSIMRSLGLGITEFKKGLRGEVDESGARIEDQRQDEGKIEAQRQEEEALPSGQVDEKVPNRN